MTSQGPSHAASGNSPTRRTEPSGQTQQRPKTASSSASLSSSSRPNTGSRESKSASKRKKETEGNMQEGKPSSATNRYVKQRASDLEAQGNQPVVMRGQGMTVVPTSVIEDKTISMLDMSSNNLRIIPPEIRRLTNLVMLDLSKNGLRCIHTNDFTGLPRELSSLSSLEMLIISECNLPFIPPVIFKCTNLRVLDISRNKINILVPEVGNLEKLQHLNAQQTSIATLPPELAYCQDLEEVLLWGNVIESLPDTLKELPKLTCLAINYRSFCCIVDSYMEGLLRKGQIQSEHIPPVLFEMPNLEILDLQETRINCLPETCVGQLKEFYLAKNFFQSMPKVLMTLDSLKVLDISSNKISSIPNKMGQLVNLEILLMNDNNLESLPTTMGSLIKLHELAMGGNKLVSIPSNIGQLRSLKTLILDRNSIRSIPSSIVQLQKLETLDLTNNKLTSLPINFDDLKGLKEAHTYHKYRKHGLWLHLNPLKSPPEKIWKTDNPENIFQYLHQLRIKRTENLQRQKIIVTGESQCGKTSLVRTMTIGKSAMTTGIKHSTPGIDFKTWKTDNDVDFLISDFGGSAEFRPVQGKLYDPKALYLVVYDHRKYAPQRHEEAIGQWIDVLRLLVPSAVVKVVGTQCDQCYEGIVDSVMVQVKERLEQDEANHRQKLQDELKHVDLLIAQCQPQHVQKQLMQQRMHLTQLIKTPLRLQPEIALVSCTAGIRGINPLINEIEKMAVNQELFPDGQRAIPKNWTEFRMALKLREDFYLNYSTVAQIASTHGINEKKLATVLHYLYDIGELLWFHQNPHLKDFIFQRPIKLMEMVQNIFRHDIDTFIDYDKNRLFASKGQFSRESFQLARNHFLNYGELSRAFLLCLWFFLRLTPTTTQQLLELIPRLDLSYLIPQPDLPTPKTEFVPLIVIPNFNQCQYDNSMQGQWPSQPPEGQKELEVAATFPLSYPSGVFERMACRIHDVVLTRIDWSNIIYAELIEDCQMLLSQGLNSENYNCDVRIQIRGCDLDAIKRNLAQIIPELRNVIAFAPGLTWFMSLKAVNCGQGDLKGFFPPEVTQLD